MHLVADLAPALARRMSDVEASDRARRAGVVVPALAAYFARPSTAQRHALLFGFAGFPEERSRNAVQALAASLPPPGRARNARAKIG
jgi:DNA-binding transcriptional MocR family regulator